MRRQSGLTSVLSDQLIVKKQIPLLEDTRPRALDPGSAYKAIEEAYGELEEQLITAAGVEQ
jgi:hypothetical protein